MPERIKWPAPAAPKIIRQDRSQEPTPYLEIYMAWPDGTFTMATYRDFGLGTVVFYSREERTYEQVYGYTPDGKVEITSAA